MKIAMLLLLILLIPLYPIIVLAATPFVMAGSYKTLESFGSKLGFCIGSPILFVYFYLRSFVYYIFLGIANRKTATMLLSGLMQGGAPATDKSSSDDDLGGLDDDIATFDNKWENKKESHNGR